jgi:hypothetical protein
LPIVLFFIYLYLPRTTVKNIYSIACLALRKNIHYKP